MALKDLLARVRGEKKGDGPLAVAVLVLGWLALVGPIFAGRSFWYRDQGLFIVPLRLYLRERLLRGELPRWNPAHGIGRPFLAWVQPAVLDPLNALLLLPAPFGQDLFNAVHHLIAAVGAYLWLRALGRSRPAATLGGVVFGYGGVFASLGNSLGPYLWGNAFIPWALLLITRAGQEVGARAFAGRSICIGLCAAQALLSGDPMAVWFIALAGVAQSVAADSAAGRRRAFAALAVGGAVSALVSAAQLLPAMALGAEYRGAGVDPAIASGFSLRPARLLELVTAAPWGRLYTRAWMVLSRDPRRQMEPFVTSLHLGAAALPLAALALTRGARAARTFALVAAAGLLLSLGLATPLWRLWYAVVLPARVFRYPEKYLVLMVVGLAPLVALGVERAAEEGSRALRTLAALGLVALVGAALGLASGASDLGSSLLRTAAVLLGAAAVLWRAGRRAWSPDARAWALVALCAADVLVASAPLMRWADAWVYQRPSRLTRRMRRELPGAAPIRVVRPVTLRTLGETYTALDFWDSLPPNWETWQGIVHVAPYEPQRDPQMDELAHALAADPVRFWRLLGARFTVQPTAAIRGMPRAWVLGSLARYELSLLRLPDAAPRVFLARRAYAARDRAAALARLGDPAFDPARDASLEGGTSGEAQGRCELVEDRVESLAVRCDAAQGGWLVVTDAFAPGWRATVGGQTARIVRANGAMRAVAVPAGRSEVRMRYEPFGFRAGCWLSVTSLLACGAALGWLARRRGA